MGNAIDGKVVVITGASSGMGEARALPALVTWMSRRPNERGPDMERNTIIISALASLSLLASACGDQTAGAAADAPATASSATPSGDSLTITRGGARSVQQGPAEWFTGKVHIEPLFAATDSSRAAASSVSFEPGARTAWHRHPRGQVLIVTAGEGRVQRRGGPVEEFGAGDVIWTPPGVEHWHGASPTTAMTHIAIYEHVNGKVVTWLEHVTDAEYGAAPRPRTQTAQ